MKPEICIVESPQALARAAAHEFANRAATAVQQKGVFSVALAGGHTPKALYSLLADDAELQQKIPWRDSHFFWGDERSVPPDHPDSNFCMAQTALLSRVPVPAANLHRIKGELAPQQAATAYEQNLAEFFHLQPDALPRFDLVLLGLGADGHTASLFPGTRALHEQKRMAVANWVDKLGTGRITLTAPVFNNAVCVIFLVSGSDKARARKAVLEGRYDPERLPAQLIRPRAGELKWILDAAAAR
ncbi:6-phosphogluconolactonase [Nitrococcus mobilis]|uniref:6-phosphogluconolactonase n=1 Tax=Nitrococcus mobilis Nb-231 TaxID=314278 RepID=A4BU42_9GAMM|nr:6-phosphogluconolactonase [Nitrococcus mobilis]EAR20716.1 6-phosphogluconolactonase [Nitrococcus mobilis Nb-231]